MATADSEGKALVEVVVEKQTFRVERRLLITHSLFFSDCLSQDKNKSKNKLKLSGISAETFNVLLDYMKTGQLNTTPDNSSDVFIAALRLHMSAVVETCLKMDVAAVSAGQYVLKYCAARRLRLQEEERQAFEYLTANFLLVTATKEFLDMNAHDLIQLVSAESLGCNSEYEVFEAGMRWLNHNPAARYKYGERIMSFVLFHNMNLTQLHQCHESFGVESIPGVRNLILNGINSWLVNEKSRNQGDNQWKPTERDDDGRYGVNEKPSLFTGTWYVLQRTDRIYNDSASCIRLDVNHKDGEIYEIKCHYKSSEGQPIEKTLTVMDDSSHPARFYFVDNDKNNIAMSVLGTDYKTWGFSYGYMAEGGKAYAVVSRHPKLPADCTDKVKTVMEKNKVTLPFQDIQHDNC